jgi:hypothetical protein
MVFNELTIDREQINDELEELRVKNLHHERIHLVLVGEIEIEIAKDVYL